ncbi:MAG: hypothetical protein D6748_13055, partial [Calditrichaeota bacterium]
MMGRFIALVFFILITGLSMDCGRKGEIDKGNMEKLKLQLEEGQSPVKETPFVEREFQPILDGKWIGEAVCYGCYRKGQAPGVKGPDEREILEDLQIISQYWNLIRVYGSDDDSERILKVIRQHRLPIRVMLGIWLENEDHQPEHRQLNIQQTLRGIQLAREFEEIVIAVNVGNETQVYWSAHRMNPADLVKYIRAVRRYVAQPVTTADDYNFWNKPESQPVAREIDFIVTHMYALWNGISLDKAISWTDSVYRAIQELHPDKRVIIGETGWATRF